MVHWLHCHPILLAIIVILEAVKTFVGTGTTMAGVTRTKMCIPIRRIGAHSITIPTCISHACFDETKFCIPSLAHVLHKKDIEK